MERGGEPLAIGERHVRPLRQVVSLQLRVVLEMNSRRTAGGEQRLPGARARVHEILISEEWAAAGHALDLLLLDPARLGGRRIVLRGLKTLSPDAPRELAVLQVVRHPAPQVRV